MVPKFCNTINAPGSHIENYYVTLVIPQHYILYNFIKNRGGFEFERKSKSIKTPLTKAEIGISLDFVRVYMVPLRMTEEYM